MKAVIIIAGVILAILLNGCSSSKETTETDTREKEIVKKPAEFKNVERKEREYIASSNIRLVDKLDFDFDPGGRLINRGKLSTIKYNREGFPVETIIYGSNNEVENRYVYKYDKNGKRTEAVRYDKAGNPDKKFTYAYDMYGNKIKSTRFNMLEKVEEYYEYEYDDEGNLTEERWIRPDGEVTYRITYDYDRRGRKTSASTYDEISGQSYKYEFMYDDSGGIVEEIKYDDEGKIGVIQYIYKYY